MQFELVVEVRVVLARRHRQCRNIDGDMKHAKEGQREHRWNAFCNSTPVYEIKT